MPGVTTLLCVFGAARAGVVAGGHDVDDGVHSQVLRARGQGGGAVHKSNPVETHSLWKAPGWFQPLSPGMAGTVCTAGTVCNEVKTWFQAFDFTWVNLYRLRLGEAAQGGADGPHAHQEGQVEAIVGGHDGQPGCGGAVQVASN
jgi:hypothetical protein